MTTRQIPSAPFDESAQNLIETDADYTLDRSVDIVDVTGPGVTLRMPANPQHGERHRLIASGGSVTIDGNGHPVGGGGVVPQGNSLDLTFSVLNKWTPEHAGSTGATGATGSAGATGATGATGGGGATGAPNAILYEDPTGTSETTDAALTAAPVDQFGRPQIRDIRFAGIGCVYRQGAWSGDGDATDVQSEGVVLYGANAQGAGPNIADGGYNRQKSNRIGLAQVINGVNNNGLFYYFRADPSSLTLRDDGAVVSFNVVRSTGKTTIGQSGGSISSGVGSPEGVLVGSPGDLYMNTSGGANTSLYVKESGVATNTGWVAK